MKVLAAILLLGAAGPVNAAQWFCQAALNASTEPSSPLAFRLILEESGAFHAEGRRDGRGFGWDGQYTRFDDQIAFIGALTSGDAAVEARALSEYMQDDVLILSLQEETQQATMVRCLRHDLR